MWVHSCLRKAHQAGTLCKVEVRMQKANTCRLQVAVKNSLPILWVLDQLQLCEASIQRVSATLLAMPSLDRLYTLQS